MLGIPRATRTAAVMLLLAVAPGASMSAAQGGPPIARLFTAAAPAARAAQGAAAHARSRAVRVDIAALLAAASDQQAIELNMFPDAVVPFVPLQRSSRGAGRATISGSVDAGEGGVAIFAVVDEAVAGTIITPEATFQLRSVGGGVHVIAEIQFAAFPEESPPLRPPRTAVAMDGDLAAGIADDGRTFDVLVLYTEAAMREAGGQAAIESLIDLAGAQASTALDASKVALQVNVVDALWVPYTESGTLSTDIDKLRGRTDGKIDAIHALRNLYGADQVHMIVKENASSCGAGYLMDGIDRSMHLQAFSVSGIDCTADNYTFAHEIGHNWGLKHARSDDNNGGLGAFPEFTFGYKDPAGAFRTIMAYERGCPAPCPRRLLYSTPKVSLQGKPAGIATGPQAADNARALRTQRLRKVVANWRASRDAERQVAVFTGNSDTWYAIDGKWKTSGGNLVSEDSSGGWVGLKGRFHPGVNFLARVKRVNDRPGECDDYMNMVVVAAKPGYWQTAGKERLAFMDGYIFYWNARGLFSVMRWIDGQSTFVKPWASTPFVSPSWNDVEVTFDASGLYFFLNDHLLYSGFDSEAARLDADSRFVGVGFAGCGNLSATDFQVSSASAYTLR